MTHIDLETYNFKYDNTLLTADVIIHNQKPKGNCIKTISNIFPYIGRPSDDITNYDKYKNMFFGEYLNTSKYCTGNDTDNVTDDTNDKFHKIINTYDEMIAEYKKIINITKIDKTKFIFNTKIHSVLTNNEKKNYYSSNKNSIYVHIDYPVSVPCVMEFTLCKNKKDITFGELLYIYTVGYQLMYISEETEEQSNHNVEPIPGMLNRSSTNGMFGIWGHYITDLVYNGISEINVSPDYICCKFSCDS